MMIAVHQMQRELTHGEYRTAMVLANHAHDDGTQSRTSVAKMAKEGEMCERSVQNNIRTLIEKKIIAVQRPATLSEPTWYRFLFRLSTKVEAVPDIELTPGASFSEPADGGRNLIPEGAQFDTGGGANSAPKPVLEPVLEPVQSLTTFESRAKPVQTIPKTFDEFWSVYPNRVGKGAAERAFLKCTKAAEPSEIIRAVGEQIRLGMFKEGYIPHPATWLNRKGWLDEPPMRVPGALQASQPHGQGYRNAALELLRREMEHAEYPPMIEADPSTSSLFGD